MRVALEGIAGEGGGVGALGMWWARMTAPPKKGAR